MNGLTYKKAWEQLVFFIEENPSNWNRDRIKAVMVSCLENVKQDKENRVENISEDDILF